jgi:inosose dehydratase
MERWGTRPRVIELLACGACRSSFSSGVLRHAPETFDDDLALHLRHARFVRACGGTFLQVVDERPRDRAPTGADHAAMARRLNALGARVADLGLTLAYHNHMGNLGQAPDEVEGVLARTDARHVRLLLDIAHWQAAGGDPVAAVRHADRSPSFLKDVVVPVDDERARARFVSWKWVLRGVLMKSRALLPVGGRGWMP